MYGNVRFDGRRRIKGKHDEIAELEEAIGDLGEEESSEQEEVSTIVTDDYYYCYYNSICYYNIYRTTV